MKFRTGGVVVGLLAILVGCHAAAPLINVKPGMTGQEVRAAQGSPFVTGTLRDTRGTAPVSMERWTYKQGDGALVIIMENDKVKESSHETDPIPAMQKKVHEGMTRAQVLAAIGEPALGNNSKDPNPNPTWQYIDPVAPVTSLSVSFQGDTAKSIVMAPNMAYGAP